MMYPAYTMTDSYADPKTKEMIPSHTKMGFSPVYQPWPYGGNHSYPVPVPHSCCNHSYYGGPYSFQPYYSHYPPPPPFQPYGLYPPYPGAYYVPPPHYSVEQPRYEYDKKNQSSHHCCVCNHREVDEKPRVEEDRKTTDSLVPFLLKDSPGYPIVWSNAEPKAKEKENEKNSHSEPVLVKHLEPTNRVGNGDDEQGNRFPFKIFWLPSKIDEMGKDAREKNVDVVGNRGSPEEKTISDQGECETGSRNAAQKVIPVKRVGTNEDKKNTESTEMMVNVEKTDDGSKGESRTGSKNTVQKVIPVKEVGADGEKKTHKSTEAKVNVEKAVNGSKASPKTSKLPPVCLRIDPLPGKKRSSRSPSPDEKKRSNRSSVDSLNSSQAQAQVLKKSQEELSEDDIISDDHSVNVPKGNGDGNEKGTGEKKSMSENEAALVIQSAYRGFEVRKSEPLKKLRQIYEVRKQVFELRDRIQDLESSSSTARIDGKKEVIIGETIMSLLLKLDTIQGLHPFVREARKSVAKELVGLQEKLDYLTSVKSETLEEAVIQGKSDEGQARSGLCVNHATESEYDDHLEGCPAPNLEQQPEKITPVDATQDKFDQEPTESDMITCENHKEEATEFQEACNSIGESELKSCKGKLEQAPTECDGTPEAVVLSEEHAGDARDCVESNDMKLEDKTKDNQLQISEQHTNSSMGVESSTNIETMVNDTKCCENHPAESVYEGHPEACTVPILEQQPEKITEDDATHDKLDQAPTESNVLVCENHEVEATELQEGCNSFSEPDSESHEETLKDAPTESGTTSEALVLSEEHAGEARDCEECHDMKLEGNTQDNQLEMSEQHGDSSVGAECSTDIETKTECCEINDNGSCQMNDAANKTRVEEEAPEENAAGGDVEMERRDEGSVVETEVKDELVEEAAAEADMIQNVEAGNVEMDDNVSVVEMKPKTQIEVAADVKSGGDAEAAAAAKEEIENEKERLVRAAVEGVMKEQLEVIRELTGRVKELEKKLVSSKRNKKKKKIKVNKGARGGCVVQKDQVAA